MSLNAGLHISPMEEAASVQSLAIPGRLSKAQQIREAALLCFCDPIPEQVFQLQYLSSRQWKKLLHWLDTSGLALYFLHRIKELDLCGLLPQWVLQRLQQNLADNAERTTDMIGESNAIQLSFQEASISYAVLKGFSLWPSSVVLPELRSQLDIDFLIAEADAPVAQRILEARGYVLHDAHGRNLDFKTPGVPGASLGDLYKRSPCRTAELHMEAATSEDKSLLKRLQHYPFHGVSMPVLAPVDLFLGQGLHFYKHVCTPCFRAAHLLEFRQHILHRKNDKEFWRNLRVLAEEHPQIPIALGVVVHLITCAMGSFAPRELTSWTVDRLPATVRLWVEIYGQRAAFATVPGSKFYLFLQREMADAGVPVKRSTLRALIPRKLPLFFTPAKMNESFGEWLRRHYIYYMFLLSRISFHLKEGTRYVSEIPRWKRQRRIVKRAEQFCFSSLFKE